MGLHVWDPAPSGDRRRRRLAGRSFLMTDDVWHRLIARGFPAARAIISALPKRRGVEAAVSRVLDDREASAFAASRAAARQRAASAGAASMGAAGHA